jgi:hypothetical protein
MLHLKVVLESSFSEGMPSDGPLGRKVINTEEDFETLHTIFGTSYTQRICLMTTPEMVVPRAPAFLTPEKIYAAAHRFHLTEPQSIALDFLSYTCTQNNTLPRMFDDFALLYDDVASKCEGQLLK